MARIVDAFQNFFSPLSGAQKALFILFSVGILSLASMLFYWALQPSYSVLFGNLNPESAQTIVEELKSSNVPYELDDNGGTIRVPRNQVHDLRLQYAAEGAAGSNYQGYELFDQNTLGMTDFMQRINKKRALEGELSRTVNNLDQVETSRIHIVLPERSAFQEATVDPSASVILNLKQGKRLKEDQIQGIGSLIAGSVEGLTIENVVILDQLGNRISDNVLVSDEVSSGSAHMRLRQETENYLTGKGQSMLDRVLGPGNSILRVSTDHNFDRLTRESNMIDPESRTVISEEERSTTNSDQTQQPVQAQNQNDPPEAMTTNQQDGESSVQVTNYEVNRTREQLEREVGELERISASILLNYKTEETTTEEGETVTEFVPYSDQEINEIRNVIRGALGVQPQRGDQLVITQIRFQDTFLEAPEEQPFFTDPVSLFELVRWIIMAIVFLVVSVMVYRMTKNFDPAGDPLLGKGQAKQKAMDESRQQYLEGETAADEDEEDIYQKKLSGEAKEVVKANEMAEEIKGFLDKNSPEAASYVRSMMRGVQSSQNK